MHIYSPFVTVTRTRRETILDILAERPVASQEELLRALAERGVHTTQPVLSRDLRALDVVKRGGTYQRLEAESVTPLETLSALLRSTCPAGANLVVVRCEPGAASAVARGLEAEEIDGVLGTVAGDDTVFVAVRDARVGARVRERVEGLLP